ncbi:MAG TPA: metallophosphoesterase [Solirubrobacterales bacterium]|nr:metallophosphoesterase [Solirubrobacterales bacterium]
MRTAIVSDLHLAHAHGEDLLRDAGIRRVLLDEIADADRLVLLGDVLELRELPLPAVLEAVRPFFEDLGEAMAGREVVFVPGNHDHRLAEPLLERNALAGQPLELEQHDEPGGEVAPRIAAWLGSARSRIAYPGIFLRDDVYATHGHYMDCHWRLPRIECVAAASAMRAFGPVPAAARPGDYERVLRPIYAFNFSLAQSGAARRASRPSERAWRALAARDRAGGRLRRTALRAAVGAGVPGAIWGVNRLLRAEFVSDLSPASITRSGIAAATELVRRLELDAAHVLTGHTHRAGPGGDDAEWELPDGGRLHNTGSWVFASAFHRPGTPPSPYWPGTVTWLEDDAPPRRSQLLLGRSRDELRGITRRLASVP